MCSNFRLIEPTAAMSSRACDRRGRRHGRLLRRLCLLAGATAGVAWCAPSMDAFLSLLPSVRGRGSSRNVETPRTAEIAAGDVAEGAAGDSPSRRGGLLGLVASAAIAVAALGGGEQAARALGAWSAPTPEGMTKKEVKAIVNEMPRLTQEVLFQRGSMTARGQTRGYVEEPPYRGKTSNGYSFNNMEEGVYASAVSGVPLFSSQAKYEAQTGWMAFYTPLDQDRILERILPYDVENPTMYQRIELLDRASMTHIGFKMEDGPKPTGYRFRIDACTMKFVPGAAPDADLKQVRPYKLAIFE
eukprot:TRINITY_DN40735_c0_g1_i1.p1 TRINITY_DN40735_c0_g1~~TRINITY_DN40735_c0_g1_i1.p1  ORF type:complete len:301 (+),score=51.09 TRINITY_DN40735_c0_g1_i1:121-1023(+)